MSKKIRDEFIRAGLRQKFGFGVYLVLICTAFFSGGCTGNAERIEMNRGEEAVQKKNYVEAVFHFKRIVDKDPKSPAGIKAAQQAARISHYELKKFTEAVDFYRDVVLYAPEAATRVNAQKEIADIYFSQLQDYNQAIAEYQKILESPSTPDEQTDYRFAIAKSYFYANNFFQALVEIDALLKKTTKPQIVFDALILKANIQLTAKDLDGAITTLKELKVRDPKRAQTESTDLVLAVCYEEKKDFTNAIEILQAMKSYYPRKEFLDRRIKSLKERQSYLPGAKGLKK